MAKTGKKSGGGLGTLFGNTTAARQASLAQQQLNQQQQAWASQFSGTTINTPVFKRKTPAQMLRDLEWNGTHSECQWCNQYPEESPFNLPLSKALPDSMKGHKEDCRWMTEMRPRIAYLELCEKGEG